jgi:hypothetical protein
MFVSLSTAPSLRRARFAPVALCGLQAAALLGVEAKMDPMLRLHNRRFGIAAMHLMHT